MVEGNSYSNILNLMRDQGYNKDITVIIGYVKKVSPLEINLGDFSVTEDDVFIAEHLLERKQKISINATVQGTTKSAGVDSHTHSLNNLIIKEAEITFHSPLAKDDGVFVLIDGDNIYLIDKVVGEQ